jgi:predicted Zn-dependent protease
LFFKVLLFTIIVLFAFLALATIEADHYSNQVEAKKSSKHTSDRNSNDLSNNEPSIQICCNWAPNKISDEGLTYRIIGGNAMAGQAVRSAIVDWTRNIDGLKFTELDSSDNSADITLKFNSKFSQDGNVRDMKLDKGISLKAIAPGATRINYNLQNGEITNAVTTVSKSVFGEKLDLDTTEQIAKHELGHALGLGHANFTGDLMSPTLNDESRSISNCDIDAVLNANHMLKDENSKSISANSFRCS